MVRLADRYLERKDLPASAELGQEEDADLNLKMKVSDILKPEQIATLKSGKPDEKSAVLETCLLYTSRCV